MTLNTDFVAHAALGKSEALQDSIATVVSLILEDKEINNYLAVSNIVFGMDANDYIDTFSKAIIKLPINPVVKPSKSFVLQLLDDLLKGNSSLGLDIQNLDVDVPEHNTFGAKAGFRLIGIPRTVSVNIPYASIGILLDESDFLHAYVGLMMTEGLVSMDVSVPFVDNKENGHKLLQVVYNLLWHQKDVLPYSFGILGVSFGASKDAAFELASKVKAPVPFGLIVGLLKGYIDGERPFELTNIPTLVNNKGIEATVFAKELPSFLPVTFKCPVFNASILYQVKGAGPLLHAADVLFTNMEVVPKKPISMEVLIVPDFERDQIVEALKEAVPFMLNGTDYCQNARLGHMTIQGSTGAVFDIMSQGYFQAPELYFYKPISLAVRPSNPFRKAGLEIIPVEFAITFPNPGPLHLDVGDFDIAINNDGRELITVQTPGSVVIKNAMHGGNDLSIPNPDNGIFRVLLPWKNLNPLEFFKHLLGLLNPKKYSLSVDVIRPSEGPIMWIRELASKLVDKDEIKVFIPVLMSLVGRIHWKLFGIKLNHRKDELEGSQEFLDRSDTIMKEYHNSSASSFFNLIVDDHFD